MFIMAWKGELSWALDIFGKFTGALWANAPVYFSFTPKIFSLTCLESELSI